jgi:hypothetical protein
MKEVYIIDKKEFEELSAVISESIIEYSKKFYGFSMISRVNNEELNDSGMSQAFRIPIMKAIKEKMGSEK